MRAGTDCHRGSGKIVTLAAVAALLVAIAALASLGLPEGPVIGLAAVLEAAIVGGGAAGAYVASAYGWGFGASKLWRGAKEEHALRMGVGLAILLSVSHAIAAVGLLQMWAAVGALAPGWALAVAAARRGVRERRRPRVSPWAPAWLPGLAVLVVAASNPPGWLWKSEAGGFDVLSYHLQLPQEWLAAGRMRPLEHNVYSFLPGYMEAAFTHLGAATGAEATGDPAASGLLAGGGWRLIACQFLHAWMAVLAAWFVRRATVSALNSEGDLEGGTRSDRAGWIAGALVLCTPWTIVTGSLAYNDMAVVGLGAAALAGAMERRLSGARRGIVCAVLVGAACGVKPTAMLLVAPGVAVALFVLVPRREWGRMCLGGALLGAVMLAPWMARNAVVCGNPVFPHLAGVFGTGHWTVEQVERYEAGHFFSGGVMERVRLLVAPVLDAEASRGITHPQWGVFGLVIVLVAAAGLTAKRHRRVAGVLAVGLGVQIVMWMAATHLQSRFLMPVLAWGGALAGVGVAQARWGMVVGMGAVAVQGAIGVVIFAQQGREGPGPAEGPNARLVQSVPGMTGAAYRESLASMSESERAEAMRGASDSAFVNLELGRGELVYLLGDSTPLYYRRPVLYHTTWDASPLGTAMRKNPGEPGEWTAALRARGVRYVLINRAELVRLQGDGWYDPLLTLQAVDAWAQDAGEVVRTWPPDAGEPIKVLIDLRP